MRQICLLIFYLAFGKAVIMDRKTRSVYRFLWWIAGGAGAMLLLSSGALTVREAPERIGGLLLFAMLQFTLFSRMYGLADCYAFTCCSMVLCSLGGGIREYLLQMLLAILLLGIVQLFRKNVNRRGNLREPVAFLPYIAASFFLMVFQLSTCTFRGFLV